jgi:putative phosphoesterase
MGETLVGVISDTHGLLRPEAVAALAGAAVIVHAGDVGRAEVLDGLRRIAPVYAVRGNVDGPWADELPETRVVEAAGARFYVLHDLKQLGRDPRVRGCQAVLSGHTHKAAQTFRGGVLYLNPGSAGPRRFRLPVTLALLHVGDGAPRAEIVTLPV